jgi:hypothetical protein
MALPSASKMDFADIVAAVRWGVKKAGDGQGREFGKGCCWERREM